ncbi:pyridoxamine 5'-phosphate oxidase family protein [Gordonia soli]|uniref:pyridoxamine 5'-phosphate oxidase family protein n=1 Tax=Gordonia soli TaxID=320799 RepID=UPI001C3F42B0|nr:pyridoxine 5'-phosphate oxidase C-terminal domain-containing protein [Gordonia soli]
MSESVTEFLRRIPTLTGDAPDLGSTEWPVEPTAAFRAWLDSALAVGVPEPHALVLSTIGEDGLPDARTLILRDVHVDRGWAFAGPASSAKGAQLAAAPVAALTFWWQPQVRSVRVRGRVVEASRAESDADLAARSTAARADSAPGDWTLWRVVPSRVEFWQGSTDRRHIRVVYSRDDAGAWRIDATRGGHESAVAISSD